MKKKVIAYGRVREKAQEKLRKAYDLQYFSGEEDLTDETFKQALREAEGIIGLGIQVDETFLNHAPHLKVISNVSVGYDNLNLDEMTKRGIAGTNTPGVLNDTTADAIFGLLLATARRIPELDRYVKQGDWTAGLPESKFGYDVHHRKLGIIGMGRIGEAIAKRGHFGFDMEILYHNRSRKPELEAEYAAEYRELNDLLAESDFVCLMTPLTPETRRLMGHEQFARMKKSAIFINGSRGDTVDETALVEALQNGEIRSAGLDVFQEEPVSSNHPLLNMNQVVTLPHIGSATGATEDEMSLLAAENLDAVLSDKRPPNLLNEKIMF
ncbi:gluconate 2-dehydrogenase [Salibacterium salarium]|uniref:2-hydroxyacid dehydrogenase n=1 Tax=Salibacterium salarium TaxID=284579 RepID=UPI00278647F6|nr:D-glycerate dehydrogenase [Salibacterium salarium]MDQ0298011.1 gluconate 2-dehydrogenase [Salibacterium salarium]